METAQDLRELWVHLHAVCLSGHRRTVVSRDLGLLKRDQKFQQRYDLWAERIKAEYGSNGNRFLSILLQPHFSYSVANYLIRSRLQWGKADTLAKLPSRLSPPVVTAEKDDVGTGKVTLLASGLPPIPPDTKSYFTADIPLQLVSIIMNDWPYSGGCTCPWLLCIRVNKHL
jgi:hypothetical protein